MFHRSHQIIAQLLLNICILVSSTSVHRTRSTVSKRAAIWSGELLQECAESTVPTSAKNVPTFEFTFSNEDHQAIDLHWLGKDSKTLLVLSTTSALSIFGRLYSPSSLWRSVDGGRHYDNITGQINADPVSNSNGLKENPVDPNMAILVAVPVLKRPRSHVYITRDAGATWKLVYIPFKMVSFRFNTHRANLLLADSAVEGSSGENGTLYLSEDYGETWKLVMSSVSSYDWGISPETVFVSVKEPGRDEGKLKLLRTDNLFKTYRVIASEIYRFVVASTYLFASVYQKEDKRSLFVSRMNKESHDWQLARLPEATKVGLFYILHAMEGLALVHVDSGGAGHGSLYISDSSGTYYSKVLDNHVYSRHQSSDFYVVKSMRGTFITSVFVPDSDTALGALVATRISFDRGARWQKIRIEDCVGVGSPEDCALHIHGALSAGAGFVPQLPASDAGAPGLVIAHGNTGSVHTKPVDVFLSRDGGYNWKKVLEGPHYYSIVDQGKLLVAVPIDRAHLADTIYFSENHGACWSQTKFSTTKWHFTGMHPDPKALGMKVTLWGYTPGDGLWQTMEVDFSKVIERKCVADDYEEWVPHAQGAKDGCLLGFKERISVIKQNVWCFMPDTAGVQQKEEPCVCDLEDFECDFGYVWDAHKTKCIVDTTLPSNISLAHLCSPGQQFYNKSLGFRRIPGDGCHHGDADRFLKFSQAPCVDHIQSNTPNAGGYDTDRHRSARIAIAVILTVASLLALAYFGYKFVLPKRGGRHSYTYTALRTSLENGEDDSDGEPTNAGTLPDDKV